MKTYWVNVRKDKLDEVSHLRVFDEETPFVALYFRRKDALKELGEDKDIFKTIKIILYKEGLK